MSEQNRQVAVPEEGLEAAIGIALYGQLAPLPFLIVGRQVHAPDTAIVNGGAK